MFIPDFMFLRDIPKLYELQTSQNLDLTLETVTNKIDLNLKKQKEICCMKLKF